MSGISGLDARRQCFEETLGQPRADPARRLAGRRIMIVGAGQRAIDDPDPPVGNGRAMALLFAREGAALTCVDVSAPALEATCAAVRAQEGSQGNDKGSRAGSSQASSRDSTTATIHAEVADVGDVEAIEPLCSRATAQMGGLDGLVMVVGVATGLSIDKQSADAWDKEFAINVRSNLLFCQQALRRMDAGGSIVLVSSLAALRNSSGNPAYETSKAAQVALARSVAMAGQPLGIRCNSLLPGLMDTPMGRAATRRRPGRLGTPLPFGRQGTGWEVAHAALFLISHESSYVNGHALVVDGGLAGGIALPPDAN